MRDIADFLLNQLVLTAFVVVMLGYPAYLHFGG